MITGCHSKQFHVNTKDIVPGDVETSSPGTSEKRPYFSAQTWSLQRSLSAA